MIRRFLCIAGVALAAVAMPAYAQPALDAEAKAKAEAEAKAKAAAEAKARRDRELAEARVIARDATVYGYPMVENYKTMHAYVIDKASKEYKAPFNQVRSEARVFGPEDKAVVTPNSDTPYSFLWADLRAEPLVLNVPVMEKARYYSLQFIDLYTHNFDYVGTRGRGNIGGKFLLAPPMWRGTLPPGLDGVVRAETELVFVVYRTQLLNAGDLENVKKLQAGYTVEPFSKFEGKPPAPAAPAISFPPYTEAKAKGIGFFEYLDFVLRFAPTLNDDVKIRAAMQKIGVGTGKPFNAAAVPADMRRALEAGMAEGRKAIDAKVAALKPSDTVFGSRLTLKGDYLARAAGAKAGIYGNSKEEAFYFPFRADAEGAPLDGSKGRYVMKFKNNDLPPVNAFWSVTMYDARTQLLVANPANRYLINSPMVNAMKRDDDGGYTIHIQKDSPGGPLETNWLPAPSGPMYVVLRAYAPKPPIVTGQWKAPAPTKVK